MVATCNVISKLLLAGVLGRNNTVTYIGMYYHD